MAEGPLWLEGVRGGGREETEVMEPVLQVSVCQGEDSGFSCE